MNTIGASVSVSTNDLNPNKDFTFDIKEIYFFSSLSLMLNIALLVELVELEELSFVSLVFT